MTTAAMTVKSEGSRYYWPNGQPCYEIPKKSGKGMKKPNITDAREMGLVPSVTTILKVANKPALNAWLMEQAALAVLTTPRLEGEGLDAFVKRVLQDEQVQDEEASAAADKGSAIHGAIEAAIQGKPWDGVWEPYVKSVFPVIESLGKIVWSEKIVVGDGYAGRADILLENDRNLTLLDFKTTKSMPKKQSWDEHRMQTAAYAETIGNSGDRHILTGNIYISTILPGEVQLFLQEDWKRTYGLGFRKLLEYWQFINDYTPTKGTE